MTTIVSVNLYRLAADIRSVKEAFLCFVGIVLVDGGLGFDGVCCGNQHIDTAAI